MWRERNEREIEGDPPCESCRVELQEENVEAAFIYQLVRGQVLTQFNGEYDVVTDINHLALWAAIDRYPGGVTDRWEVFNKVRRVFFHFLNRQEG